MHKFQCLNLQGTNRQSVQMKINYGQEHKPTTCVMQYVCTPSCVLKYPWRASDALNVDFKTSCILGYPNTPCLLIQYKTYNVINLKSKVTSDA